MSTDARASHLDESVDTGGEPPGWPAISVVMPVLNEERHLVAAVRHVLAQDYPGDLEVVLAIGPSKDRTWEIAEEFAGTEPRVTVVANPSGRTPAALNAAVAASRHPVIARVDGHAMLPDDYLRVAVRALRDTGAENVGGVMAAEGVTAFEQAAARAMTSRFGVGNAAFHTGGRAGPADTVYLGVFRRSALDRVGGYNEEYIRAQDWEMNHRIRQTGGTIWFEPRMHVSYRPRPNLAALAKQYFHYGRWRRVVARQHKGTINLRYLAPPAAVVGVVGGCAAGAAGYRPAFAIPGAYVAGVLGAALLSGRGLTPAARAWLPLVYAGMHLPWGLGFLTSPRGLVPRKRSRRR